MGQYSNHFLVSVPLSKLSFTTQLIDLISLVFPHRGVTGVARHLEIESFFASLLPPEFLNARPFSCAPSFKVTG